MMKNKIRMYGGLFYKRDGKNIAFAPPSDPGLPRKIGEVVVPDDKRIEWYGMKTEKGIYISDYKFVEDSGVESNFQIEDIGTEEDFAIMAQDATLYDTVYEKKKRTGLIE